MIIEFLGIPGSGKTFLTKQLKLLNKDIQIFPNEENRKKYNVFLFCLKNVFKYKEFFLSLNYKIIFDVYDDYKSQIKYFFMICDSLRYLKIAEKEKISIVTEGIIQKLYSTYGFSSNYTEYDLNNYLKHIKKPDLLIILEVDPNIALKRLIGRKDLPFNFINLDLKEILDYLSIGNKFISDILNLYNGEYIIFNNNNVTSEDIKKLYGKIFSKIKNV